MDGVPIDLGLIVSVLRWGLRRPSHSTGGYVQGITGLEWGRFSLALSRLFHTTKIKKSFFLFGGWGGGGGERLAVAYFSFPTKYYYMVGWWKTGAWEITAEYELAGLWLNCLKNWWKTGRDTSCFINKMLHTWKVAISPFVCSPKEPYNWTPSPQEPHQPLTSARVRPRWKASTATVQFSKCSFFPFLIIQLIHMSQLTEPPDYSAWWHSTPLKKCLLNQQMILVMGTPRTQTHT